MGPRPSKRNVDWDGDGMSEEQRYDRPTPYIVATSTPELKRGEKSVDDANRHHDGGPGLRPGVPAGCRQGRPSKLSATIPPLPLPAGLRRSCRLVSARHTTGLRKWQPE